MTAAITVRARDGQFHAQCRRRGEDGQTHIVSASGETASAARTALLQRVSGHP